MPKIVIGIAGEIASGKDAVERYIVEKYGAAHMGFSDTLRDVLDRLHLPHERINMATLAEALRATFGEDLLARVLVDDVRNTQADLVVIDGIRKQGEMDELKTLENFHSVFVDADLKTRYERIVRRGQNPDDNTKTFEEFVKDNAHAADASIRYLKEQADFVIDNNGTVEELHRQVDEIMGKLI